VQHYLSTGNDLVEPKFMSAMCFKDCYLPFETDKWVDPADVHFIQFAQKLYSSANCPYPSDLQPLHAYQCAQFLRLSAGRSRNELPALSYLMVIATMKDRRKTEGDLLWEKMCLFF